MIRNELSTGFELISYCMVGTENTGNYVAFKFGWLSETPPVERIITGIIDKKLPKCKQMRAKRRAEIYAGKKVKRGEEKERRDGGALCKSAAKIYRHLLSY